MLKPFLPLVLLFLATACCTPPSPGAQGMECSCCKQGECCCKGMKEGAEKDKPCPKCLKKKGEITAAPSHKM
jgi:hypothetical protein